MAVLGLVLSSEVLKTDSIKNYTFEALSFDVIRKLEPIVRKPDSHCLGWLELGINAKKSEPYMQANRCRAFGRETRARIGVFRRFKHTFLIGFWASK